MFRILEFSIFMTFGKEKFFSNVVYIRDSMHENMCKFLYQTDFIKIYILRENFVAGISLNNAVNIPNSNTYS